MEEKKLNNPIMKNIIDPEQIKKAKEILIVIRNKTKKIFHSRKNDKKTLITITIVIFCIAIYR
jgi:hypothetical protein